jgi:hypothetical protein
VSARGLGAVALCLLLGAGLGAGAAYATRPAHHSSGSPAPVPAKPSAPGEKPYADDIPWPTLRAVTEFDHYEIDNTLETWTYPVPKGWVGYRVPSGLLTPPEEIPEYDEMRFRPRFEPLEGGFSLRVKIIDNHELPADEILDRIAGFDRTYDDYDVLEQTDDAVYFTFRDTTNRLRYNFFRWFVAPGSNEATLEMSVAGRAEDEEGLRALFDAFAEQAHPVD